MSYRDPEIEAFRREQIKQTWKCFIWALAMVGAAACVSGAFQYFAA